MVSSFSENTTIINSIINTTTEVISNTTEYLSSSAMAYINDSAQYLNDNNQTTDSLSNFRNNNATTILTTASNSTNNLSSEDLAENITIIVCSVVLTAGVMFRCYQKCRNCYESLLANESKTQSIEDGSNNKQKITPKNITQKKIANVRFTDINETVKESSYILQDNKDDI